VSTRPFEKLPTIRGKLGSTIVFAVGMTVALILLMLGYALRGSAHDSDRLQLQAAARQTADGSMRGLPEGVTIVRTTAAGQPVGPAPSEALPPDPDMMAHTGRSGSIEYAVVPVVEGGRVTQLVYAIHAAPRTGCAS
jgi:hypothetical protein